MRILLDESLPIELRSELGGHDVLAKSNRIDELRSLVPELIAVLSALEPRTLTLVGI